MNFRMNFRSLVLSGLLGVTTVTSLSMLMPTTTQAYITRQEIRVERLRNESYDVFMRRSEVIARAAIQRAFDRDIVMSSVVLYIIGQHQGMEAQVMSVEVSRSQWQARPDARVWATYYRMSQRLLGFGDSVTPDLPQAPGPIPTITPNPFSPWDAQPGNSIPINPRPTIRLPIRRIPRPIAPASPAPTASPTPTASPAPTASPTPEAPPSPVDPEAPVS